MWQWSRKDTMPGRKLDRAERTVAMAALPDWTPAVGRDAIERSFHFPDFEAAFSFMTACARKAEEMNHHPEWFHLGSRVDVTLSTHDVGGLTHRDIDLALFMDELVD